jgi:hypothetical protein
LGADTGCRKPPAAECGVLRAAVLLKMDQGVLDGRTCELHPGWGGGWDFYQPSGTRRKSVSRDSRFPTHAADFDP